jgi:uncharacterized protein (TIGR03435 family)
MRLFVSILMLTGAAFAQSAAPSFTVADIHPSGPAGIFGTGIRGPFFGGNRYEIHSASMVELIQAAYGVDPERVLGGPGWVEFDHYDILAVAPPGSTAESRKLMLQSLLADRFKLVLHNDTKPAPAYVLTGRSTKLQTSSGGDGCNFNVIQGPPPAPPEPGAPRPPVQLPVIAYTCRGVTMASFAKSLAAAPGANQYFDNKPVVDKTEMEGTFDFTLRYTPKVPPTLATTGENIPLFEALDKQLGLKVELSTAPMPVVTVDGAIETPTPNPPDVTKSLPSLATEFDVAEIKPSPPGQGNVQPEIKNGRFILPGITLQNLMAVAWGVNPNQDMIGAPKWLNTTRFDIIAKAPEGVALGDMTPSVGRGIPINIDALQPMIRNLIVEKFQLKVHMEDRPTTGYTLVAVKPKVQKADPNGRTKCTEGPGADGKDPRKTNPILGRLLTCTNMSMAQFSKLLQQVASGYVHDDVVDATGLEGKYDFTLSFSGAGLLPQNGGGGGRSGDGPPGADAATDPNGALSLLDALPKQLGLKLESQKRSVPTLVIDHVDEKPSGN